MSNSENVQLDPNKAYGRFDREDPYLVLGTDLVWDRVNELLQKAQRVTAPYDDAREHWEQKAELHIENILEYSMENFEARVEELLS